MSRSTSSLVLLTAGALLAGGCAVAPVRTPMDAAALASRFQDAVPPPPPTHYPAAPPAAPEATAPATATAKADHPTPALASLSPEAPGEVAHARARILARQDALADLAGRLVGRRRLRLHGHRYRADCSGLAQAVYRSEGIDLFADGASHRRENGVAIIYGYVRRRGGLHRDGPHPGDLVFFHDTLDRNRDGRRDDPLTHVALVERIRADGTVVLVQYGSRGVDRAYLDLAHPHRHRDPKTHRVVNSYLRRGRHGSRLAAELFAGFGTVVR